MGKLNVVFQRNGKSRLIMDGSVLGTNQSCHINERYNLPSIQDVRAAYPLRESTSEISAFSLDVKSAHKSIRIRERDRGLVGIKTEDDRYFWYKVCPFGTSFSTLRWRRLSSWFVRALHLLLYIAHTLKMFVDDLMTSWRHRTPHLCRCQVLPSWRSQALSVCRYHGQSCSCLILCYGLGGKSTTELGPSVSHQQRSNVCWRQCKSFWATPRSTAKTWRRPQGCSSGSRTCAHSCVHGSHSCMLTFTALRQPTLAWTQQIGARCMSTSMSTCVLCDRPQAPAFQSRQKLCPHGAETFAAKQICFRSL